MDKAHLSKDARSCLDAILHQPIISIDAPESEATGTGFSLNNLSAIRFVMGDASTLFFSPVSVYLTEGVEVFVPDVTRSLNLHKYPGGPPISWRPITQIAEKFDGITLQNIRLLSAEWRIVPGVEGKPYYGNDPQILVCDLSERSDSYVVEDGLILSTDDSELIVSTMDTLPETLSLRYTRR